MLSPHLVSVQKQLGCFLALFRVISPKKYKFVFERGPGDTMIGNPMEQFNKITAVSLGTLILLLVIACSQSVEPTATAGSVGISDIPVYDGATHIDTDESIEAFTVIAATENTIAGTDITLEAAAYSLPAGATWDDVRAFYTKALESTDWKPEEKLTNEGPEHKSAGWRREASPGKQILLITYASNVSGEGSTLIMMLLE
jgi:hypothetical protein